MAQHGQLPLTFTDSSNEENIKVVKDDVKMSTSEETIMLVKHRMKKRQIKWIGHAPRGDSLLRTIIEGKMEGSKTRGRPRQMMLDWITL